MTDTTDTTEGDVSDATPDVQPADTGAEPTEDPEVFPREVVADLRKENAKYRQRAGQADAYAQRLHVELVRATGRLADPTDLAFDEEHLGDPEKLTAAVDQLLAAKPHLATRKPAGDIGQGGRGSGDAPMGLLDLLKMHT